MKFLIINGPSMGLLGIREPELYGKADYPALIRYIEDVCADVGVEPTFLLSNHEGEIVDAICDAYGKFDGIVINPAAYTHTSVAIADALRAVAIPAAEVHLTDVTKREDFRKISYVRDAVLLTAMGKGFESYREAITALSAAVKSKKT